MTARLGPVVPARITLALDLRQLHGPEVDIACGAVEPAVDRWESGEETPTDEQVVLLATLTGQPVAYFYEPATDAELQPTRIFICHRRRRKHALTVVESRIDDRGVLHVDELTEPHPPLRQRAPRRTAVIEIPEVPVERACSTCMRPLVWLWSARRREWIAVVAVPGDPDGMRVHRCSDQPSWRDAPPPPAQPGSPAIAAARAVAAAALTSRGDHDV